MVSPLCFSPLPLIALVWLCIILPSAWPRDRLQRLRPPAPAPVAHPPTSLHRLLACPQSRLVPGVNTRPPPHPPSHPLPPPTRRSRVIDTARPCCPHAAGDDRGGLGLGNGRANGPPPRCSLASVPLYWRYRVFFGTPRDDLSGPTGVRGADGPRAGGLSRGLPTICQPQFVTFFTPSARPAHDASGLHHSRCDDAAWPPGYAAVGRQYCVRPGHAAAPSPATPYTRC